MAKNQPKTVFSYLSKADMLMPIEMRTHCAATVVDVQKHKSLKTDQFLELIQRGLQAFWSPQFIACSEEMACVQTDAQTGSQGIEGIDDGGNLFQRAAHAVLGSGGVFQEKDHVVVSLRKTRIYSLNYPFISLVPSGAQMKDSYLQPQLSFYIPRPIRRPDGFPDG